LTRTLENLPIESLVAEATETLRSIRALASAPEVKSGLVKADRVLSDVDELVRHVDSKIDPLSARVDQAAVETRTTMAQTQAALARLTPAATATLADYQALAQDTRKLVAHADTQIEILSTSLQQALADTHSVLGDHSPLRYDLANTLQEMTKTAKSLRTLAEYLERHPEALLMASSGTRADEGVARPARRDDGGGRCALALAGCAASPATRFYVLTPVEVDGAAPSSPSDAMTIGVRSVDLPEALERPQIMTRTGPNTVYFAEFDQWSARSETASWSYRGNLASSCRVTRWLLPMDTRYCGGSRGHRRNHTLRRRARRTVCTAGTLAGAGTPRRAAGVYGESTFSDATGWTMRRWSLRRAACSAR